MFSHRYALNMKCLLDGQNVVLYLMTMCLCLIHFMRVLPDAKMLLCICYSSYGRLSHHTHICPQMLEKPQNIKTSKHKTLKRKTTRITTTITSTRHMVEQVLVTQRSLKIKKNDSITAMCCSCIKEHISTNSSCFSSLFLCQRHSRFSAVDYLASITLQRL